MTHLFSVFFLSWSRHSRVLCHCAKREVSRRLEAPSVCVLCITRTHTSLRVPDMKQLLVDFKQQGINLHDCILLQISPPRSQATQRVLKSETFNFYLASLQEAKRLRKVRSLLCYPRQYLLFKRRTKHSVWEGH